MDLDEYGGNKRVFNRLSTDKQQQQQQPHQQQKVCFHWRAGKCTRRPCNFLHRELPAPHLTASSNGNGSNSFKRYPDESSSFSGPTNVVRRNSNNHTWGRIGNKATVKKMDKICHFWVQGNCNYKESCRYLHSWSIGEGFSLLTQLDGHQNVISGVALPSGSDKLYTGSKDETVRAWDCGSGQCMGVLNLGGEVGCMISEGPWIFVGTPNSVKAWNFQSNIDMNLSGPVGQVYAMVVGNGMLFAGTQDGSILAWKFDAATNAFHAVTSLQGHTLGVVTLVVGANRLCSGSMDKTIKVWNLETFQCMQTLTDHSSVVMCLLFWDQFLLSCSLDKTIKIWVTSESGNMEVTYTHNEEQGVITICGMLDLEGKPVLLSSCNDNSVRLYDLPSFSERGKLFSKEEVRAIQTGPPGLFFTGDGTGQVRVWQWSTAPVQSTT
ncbi:hypothetical protein ACFE04_004607 [Oxalis oulophora]